MPRSLRGQLITSVWIGIVAVMFPFSVYILNSETNKAINGQFESLRDQGRLTQYILQRWTRNLDDLMEIIALSPAIRRLDGESAQTYFERLGRLYPLRSWRLVTASGELIAGTNVNLPITRDTLLQRSYIQQSLRGKSIAGVFADCLTKAACYLHSVPVYSPGTSAYTTVSDKPNGVLIMEINLKDTAEDSGMQGEFSRIYSRSLRNSTKYSLPKILSLQSANKTGLEVLMVDREGRVVFPLSTINDNLSVQSPATLLAGVWGPIIKTGLSASDAGRFQEVRAAGSTFYTYSQVVDQDWSVVVTSDAESTMEGIYQDARSMALLALIFLVIVSVVIAAVCQRAAKPIQRAAATVKAFSAGDFEARIDSDRDDEVGNLFKNINETGASLRLMINERLQHAVTDKQIETAAEIQKEFILGDNLSSNAVQIAAEFDPAYEIGADWYDVIHTGETVYIVVADVCDKGVPSALFMSVFRSLLRFSLDRNESHDVAASAPATRLGETVKRVNDYMAENHGDSAMFATVFMAAYHPGSQQLHYINAGHEKPYIIKSDGSQVDLEVTGPALGIFKSAKFQVKQLGFHRGDILFAFTDGLVDARSPGGEAFGLSRVATMLSNVKSVECNVSELLKTVLSAVKHHCGTAEQFDDMTILIMKSGST
jgi:serine phosphatase RsbU (regulator of sigma subunit)